MMDVTGRDGYIINQALAYAIVTIDNLPPRQRAESDRNDMRRLLAAHVGEPNVDDYLTSVRSVTGWKEGGTN